VSGANSDTFVFGEWHLPLRMDDNSEASGIPDILYVILLVDVHH